MSDPVDEKLCAANRSVILERLSAVEKSIKVAKDEMDRRLEAMNEFRAQLTNQANTYMTRAEITMLTDKNSDGIKNLRQSMDIHLGSSRWADKLIMAVIGFGLGLAAWLIK